MHDSWFSPHLFSRVLTALFGMKWYISVLHVHWIPNIFHLGLQCVFRVQTWIRQLDLQQPNMCFTTKPIGFMLTFPSFSGSHWVRWWLRILGGGTKSNGNRPLQLISCASVCHWMFLLLCLLEVNATQHVQCVMENKVCRGCMFVQQIGDAMCSFSHSHEYLQLAYNGIWLKKKERTDRLGFKLSCKKETFLTFYHCAVWGVSHGLFLTLFHPHVAQECILEVQWIKMPCQPGRKKENLHSELSVIFPSRLYHGKLVKSSPSSHKLAGRFISPLTFSLEMPPGTWASALWREMTGLLLGAAVVESYSLASSPLSLFYFSPASSLSFFLLMKPFRKGDDSHLKGKGQGSHLSISPY